MPTDSEPVNHTLALLRAMNKKLDLVIDTSKRHGELLARVSRDVAEMKSDLVLMENKILTAQAEIFAVVVRLDDTSSDGVA